MEELTLQEIKQIEFDLLKRFHAFCVENNIRYFLSNGTLLGSIKYKGFIPWDDDIDVLVPRQDYDRLISLFEDGEYCLFSPERHINYSFPFAKLCDMSTYKEEHNIDNGVRLGVDIDIFPLDFWDDDFEIAQREVKSIRKDMFYLGLTKLHKADSANWLKRLVKSFVMLGIKLFGPRYFVRRIVKKSNSDLPSRSAFLGCKTWCIYGIREIIPAEVFSDIIEVEFEGQKFPAPIGYDIYLRSLYGEYEKDPPLEKQKTHHSYTAYRL